MIDYYTGTPQEQSKSEFYEASDLASMQLNTLTLERNSVLVARIPKNSGYDMSLLQDLRKTLKEAFPYHQVIVWYDDVDFMAIHDNGYPQKGLEGINNDDSSNYY